MKTMTVLIAAGSLIVSGAAAAQSTGKKDSDKQSEEPEDAIYADDESVPSEKCLRPKMIKATHVLDDRNILFVMRNNKVYRNVLPRKCRDLARIGAFSYQTTYGRICDIDRISVGGPGGVGGSLGAGRNCRLGPFYPVTVAELKAMAREAEMTRELDADAEQ